MGKTYTLDEQLNALSILDANGKSFALTERELDISERSLRYWDTFRDGILKRFGDDGDQLEEPKRTYPRPLDEPFEEDHKLVKELEAVREKVMRAINHLTEKLDAEDGLIHLRAMAFSRLIDRVKVLDEQILAWRSETSTKRVIIEYSYGGMIHDRPPWENRTEEERARDDAKYEEKRAREWAKIQAEEAGIGRDNDESGLI